MHVLPHSRALAYSREHAARRAAGESGLLLAQKYGATEPVLVPAMSKGNPFVRVGLSAPAIAVGYAAIAYTLVSMGCMPLFSDVDFFGVRVTMFLLAALSGAALVLIVLACLNSLRVLRTL
jgi:hypothetical protein